MSKRDVSFPVNPGSKFVSSLPQRFWHISDLQEDNDWLKNQEAKTAPPPYRGIYKRESSLPNSAGLLLFTRQSEDAPIYVLLGKATLADWDLIGGPVTSKTTADEALAQLSELTGGVYELTKEQLQVAPYVVQKYRNPSIAADPWNKRVSSVWIHAVPYVPADTIRLQGKGNFAWILFKDIVDTFPPFATTVPEARGLYTIPSIETTPLDAPDPASLSLAPQTFLFLYSAWSKAVLNEIVGSPQLSSIAPFANWDPSIWTYLSAPMQQPPLKKKKRGALQGPTIPAEKPPTTSFFSFLFPSSAPSVVPFSSPSAVPPSAAPAAPSSEAVLWSSNELKVILAQNVGQLVSDLVYTRFVETQSQGSVQFVLMDRLGGGAGGGGATQFFEDVLSPAAVDIPWQDIPSIHDPNLGDTRHMRSILPLRSVLGAWPPNSMMKGRSIRLRQIINAPFLLIQLTDRDQTSPFLADLHISNIPLTSAIDEPEGYTLAQLDLVMAASASTAYMLSNRTWVQLTGPSFEPTYYDISRVDPAGTVFIYRVTKEFKRLVVDINLAEVVEEEDVYV